MSFAESATASRRALRADEANPVLVRRLFLSAALHAGSAAALPRLETGVNAGATWEAAARLACRVGQEPLFLSFAATSAPAEALPLPTLEDLKTQAQYHAFRWEAIRDALTAVLAELAGRGIAPILLKGAALAGERFEPPHLRPMRDADILVRPEDVAGAREAALRAGFVPDPARHPEAKYTGHHHAAPLYHRATGVCLELHYHLMRLPPWFSGFPPLADLWSRPRASRVFSGKALLLEPTLEVVATCVHHTHGDAIGRRAQYLIDLARLIQQASGSIDWDRLLGYAGSMDVARSLTVPLRYLARDGLPSAPEPVSTSLHTLSGLKPWEEDLLFALTDRYRLGSPLPWRRVSGRLANIVWRETLRRGGAVAKLGRTVLRSILGHWIRRG